MLDALQNFFQDFVRSFGFRDLLDVTLLSAVLFLLLGWLREQLSRNMIVAVSVFLGVYVATRIFRLYMVELAFRALFFVILLAIVVVFQSDIRRLVERVGLWISRGTTRVSEDGHTVDTLIEAAQGMAEAKTGALIAIRGKEEWERLIDGGVQHGGRVSLPLLYSLFNPSSPAHDGAVLMEGGKITRFGAHLPLSKNLNEVGEHGTRHTAALGLAEACDAFVIVISEEQGTISLAHGGKLVKTDSASDLKRQLEEFWRTHYEAPKETTISWWSRKRLQTASLSVSLAMLSWFLFVFDPGVGYRTFTVPVQLRNLPENWSFGDPSPTEVRVTLSGSQAAFQLLNQSDLTVNFDLKNIREGENSFVIEDDDLTLPPDMYLYDAEPDAVSILAEQLRRARLPVRIQTTGAVPDSLQLIAAAVEPDSVEVLVPHNSTLNEIRTDSVDISGLSEPTLTNAGLILPDGARWPEGTSREVEVRLQTRARPESGG